MPIQDSPSLLVQGWNVQESPKPKTRTAATVTRGRFEYQRDGLFGPTELLGLDDAHCDGINHLTRRDDCLPCELPVGTLLISAPGVALVKET